MIILTMNVGSSWILIEKTHNWAMLQNKLWTLTSNLLFYPRNIRWCDTCGMHLGILILAPHAKQSMKTDHSRHHGGSKQQHNIHWPAMAMVNEAEHIYQVKASFIGIFIVATQLWSKSITDQSLTRIAEGLCRSQVTSKNNYFVKSMCQLLFLVVAKKVELNPNAIPGGRPQIIRLRIVQFEVDGSVYYSCEFFERVGIVRWHILAIVQLQDESMVDVRWRASLDLMLESQVLSYKIWSPL
jgi:hypothetical protein